MAAEAVLALDASVGTQSANAIAATLSRLAVNMKAAPCP
jgi:hypothetical protein